VHGLGHGIGRQVHELPALARTSGARLRAGMIVTVEPGIYLPGIGGIRIEDDILITRTGRQRLSSLPRALEAVVLR
jgi:Xaa-Pro aminopeptidase